MKVFNLFKYTAKIFQFYKQNEKLLCTQYTQLLVLHNTHVLQCCGFLASVIKV